MHAELSESIALRSCTLFHAPGVPELRRRNGDGGRLVIDVYPGSRNNIADRIVDAVDSRVASNAHDISFGFISKIEKYAVTNTPSPVVDYSLAKTEVFKQLTVYLVANTGTLSPLNMSGGFIEPSSPSWVPDFTKRRSVFRLLYINPRANETRCRAYPSFPGPDFSVLVVRGSPDTLVTEALDSRQHLRSTRLRTTMHMYRI